MRLLATPPPTGQAPPRTVGAAVRPVGAAPAGTGSRRLPGLDGLRGLAVAAVVSYHVDPAALPGGFLGVDVFFVLSGCLITRLLLLDRAGGPHTRPARSRRHLLTRFYARRARRLLPALVALLAGVCVAALLVWHDQLDALKLGLPAVASYATNWWLIGRHESYFAAAGRPSMLQHLWSLAVEEQFYLVWPLVVLACRRVRHLVAVALTLAASSTVALWLLAVAGDVPYGDDGSRLYYGTDTHSAGLLVGAALGGALTLRRHGGRPPVWLTDALAVAALTALGAICLRYNEFSPVLYRGGLLCVALLAAGTVAAVVRPGSVAGGLLDAPPLRWLGARSYGIYLWHWPVVVVTRPGIDLDASPRLIDAGRIALTLLLAEASHRLVEAPWRAPAPTPTGELSSGLSRTGAYGVRTAARRAYALRPRLAFGGGAALVALTVTATLALDHRPSAAAVSVAPGAPAPAAVTGPAAPASTGPHPAATRSAPAQPARACADPVVRGPAAAFGDSVLLGAQPALAKRFPGVSVDAVVGVQARLLLTRVRAGAATGHLAGTVVLHTGDNGVVSPADLRQTLAALHAGPHPARRILLLTVRVDRPWQDPNDDVLRAAAARDPGVTLVDWASYAGADGGHPGWFYDGLHLTPTGATAYARLVAAAALGCPPPPPAPPAR